MLGVTVESISSGELSTRHWTGEQGTVAVVAAEECTNNAALEWLLPACRDTQRVLDGRAWLFHGGTVLNLDFWIFHLTAPDIYITNWELTFADGAGTTTKMVPTDDVGLIQWYTEILWRFSKAKVETLPLHQSIAIYLEPGYNLPYGQVYNSTELGGAIFTQLRGLKSCAHAAGLVICTEWSHAIWTNRWVGTLLWWTICHRIMALRWSVNGRRT